jgi:uncharacterized protein YprB with RNaseH-like and TPR domain
MQESDSSELRRRLRRLGRRKRASPRKTPPAINGTAGLPPGEVLQTPHGETYRITRSFALEHVHGAGKLCDLLAHQAQLAGDVAGQAELGEFSIDQFAFLDTETTGLSGGAGTLVFLVGVGAFTDGGFRLHQYFLRDPGEEPALLHALQEDLEAARGFVTFNGRAFDIPLLEMRYVIGLQRRWALGSYPHLDLLFPARRLWQRMLPDCTLSTLERDICGVKRTGEDVPGSEIPSLYMEFLRTGDATDMHRVIYHNEIDVLSLVTLASQILDRYSSDDLDRLAAPEALAVARWHQLGGRSKHADQAYTQARSASVRGIRLDAIRYQTIHLKREGRHEEALEAWRAWCDISPDDPRPCIELAKYYEWHAKDLEQALAWTESALVTLSHWSNDWRRDQVWGEIAHRMKRLSRKLGRED